MAVHAIYANRAGLPIEDLKRCAFGPIKRALLESRLKGDVPGIIAKLRTRLEGAGATR